MKVYIIVVENSDGVDVFEEVYASFEAAKEHVKNNDYEYPVHILCYEYNEQTKDFIWSKCYTRKMTWIEGF